MRNFLVVLFVCVAMSSSFSWADDDDNQSPTKAEIRELQSALILLGHYLGPVDGLMGPNTRDSIERFQRKHGLEVNGKYSDSLHVGVHVAQSNADKAEEAAEARIDAYVEDITKASEYLKSLDREELIRRIQDAEPEQAFRMINLLGEKAKNLPVRLGYPFLKGKKPTDLVVEMMLRSLYYDINDESVKQAQRDLGDDSTDELTFGQFERLSRRSIRAKDTPVYAERGVGQIEMSWYQDQVTARGTWTLKDEEIGYPINTATITCRLTESKCKAIQAHIVVPSLDSSQEYYRLELAQDSYEVESWNDTKIVAIGGRRCQTYTLHLDWDKKSVWEVTTRNPNKKCLLRDKIIGSLKEPRTAVLKPGFEITRQWWKQREKETRKFYSSQFRKRVEEIAETIDMK